LGTTQTYTMPGPDGPVTITADGFTAGFGTPVNLFGKNDGGDENGLGLSNDPTLENEISGTSFIRISFPSFPPGGHTGATGSFKMGSVTEGESWLVLASFSPTTGYMPLLAGNDELSHRLPQTGNPGFDLFSFYIARPQTGTFCSLLFRLLPARSPVQDCRASSWRAVAYSAGGDGGRRLPDPLINLRFLISAGATYLGIRV
jgi:hypothetical protein